MKNLLFLLLLVGLISFSNCSHSTKTKNGSVVIRVDYSNDRYMHHRSVSYSVIDIDKLQDFKFVNDTVNGLPSILYNVTFNGGVYLSESFTSLYTLGCCEYGNIQKAIQEYANKNIAKTLLDEYASIDQMSFGVFDTNQGVSIDITEGEANYHITFWSVNIEYCTCPLYMETPQQSFYDNQAGYIKSLKSVARPTPELERQVKSALSRMQ